GGCADSPATPAAIVPFLRRSPRVPSNAPRRLPSSLAPAPTTPAASPSPRGIPPPASRPPRAAPPNRDEPPPEVAKGTSALVRRSDSRSTAARRRRQTFRSCSPSSDRIRLRRSQDFRRRQGDSYEIGGDLFTSHADA